MRLFRFIKAMIKFLWSGYTLASRDEARWRLIACKNCQFLKKGICEPCGCFVRFKVQCKSERCPKFFWY